MEYHRGQYLDLYYLLFIIYINDLPLHVEKSSVDLYADDSTLHCHDKSIDNINAMLQMM